MPPHEYPEAQRAVENLKEGIRNMAKTSKVAKVGIKKEAGFLYYVDRQGDVSRVLMQRGGVRRSARRSRR